MTFLVEPNSNVTTGICTDCNCGINFGSKCDKNCVNHNPCFQHSKCTAYCSSLTCSIKVSPVSIGSSN